MSRKSQSSQPKDPIPKDIQKDIPKEDNKDDKNKNSIDVNQDNNELNKNSNMSNDKSNQGQGAKFQSLPLREYYDSSLSSVLQEGLRELGRQRPENPIQFLGYFLLDHDPEKNKK